MLEHEPGRRARPPGRSGAACPRRGPPDLARMGRAVWDSACQMAARLRSRGNWRLLWRLGPDSEIRGPEIGCSGFGGSTRFAPGPGPRWSGSSPPTPTRVTMDGVEGAQCPTQSHPDPRRRLCPVQAAVTPAGHDARGVSVGPALRYVCTLSRADSPWPVALPRSARNPGPVWAVPPTGGISE
jgi:hypothetical protein